MTLRQFIKAHRSELDAAIKGALCNHPRHATPCPLPCESCAQECTLNDLDRREWILNDETLYRWARCEGVKI